MSVTTFTHPGGSTLTLTREGGYVLASLVPVPTVSAWTIDLTGIGPADSKTIYSDDFANGITLSPTSATIDIFSARPITFAWKVAPDLSGVYLPTTALVAVAWIGQRVPGIAESMVATKLPREISDWAASGFVQVTVIPGGTEVDSGGRRLGMVQIDAWGVNLKADGSAVATPAVHKATKIAELVRRATDDDVQTFGRPVTMPANYLPARVLSAYPTTDPSPVPDDPSGYGRVTFDLALDWVRL